MLRWFERSGGNSDHLTWHVLFVIAKQIQLLLLFLLTPSYNNNKHSQPSYSCRDAISLHLEYTRLRNETFSMDHYILLPPLDSGFLALNFFDVRRGSNVVLLLAGTKT